MFGAGRFFIKPIIFGLAQNKFLGVKTKMFGQSQNNSGCMKARNILQIYIP